jgi:RNA polymerase subunit RPABC4/transcription elongation factor Spt4
VWAQVVAESPICDSCGLTLDFVQDREGNLIPPDDQENAEEDGESEDREGVPVPTQVEGCCVACGAVLDESRDSCPSCGLVYPSGVGDAVGMEDGEEPESELSPLCPSCGIPTDEESRSCPQCARSLFLAQDLD